MIDTLIFLITIGMVYSGYRQGFLKDLIHFILWLSTGVLMAWASFSSLDPANVDPAQAFQIVKKLGYLFSSAYIMMMLVEKFVIVPAIFGSIRYQPSTASSIFGALFGLSKIVVIAFASTFLFNVYSQTANPELPPLLNSSVILKSTENLSADLYDYVTDQGWLEYNKVVWQAEEPATRKNPLGDSFYKRLLNHSGN